MLVATLTCPRCWSPSNLFATGTLTYLCPRCEWPFVLAAPAVASPAVPLTTVAAVNTTGTVVAVTITGGTLTFVYVNSAQVGTTAGTYLVPVAGNISITYSVAPTWAWALPAISPGVSASATALPFTAGGTSFSQGQVLIVDPSGTPEVAAVNGTPTATSVPVNSLGSAHLTGVHVAVARATTALSGTGLENVPQTAY